GRRGKRGSGEEEPLLKGGGGGVPGGAPGRGRPGPAGGGGRAVNAGAVNARAINVRTAIVRGVTAREVTAAGIGAGSIDDILARTAPSKASRPRRGRQIDRTKRALRKLFPPEGKIPAEMEVETARGRVAAELAEESRGLGLADPSWDVVNAAIKELGRAPA